MVVDPSRAVSRVSPSDLTAFSTLIRSLAQDSASLFSSTTEPLSSHLGPTTHPSSPSSSSSETALTPKDPLLTLRSSLLLAYTQHLFLLSSHRSLGLSIAHGQGKELVQSLVRIRVTLDKIKGLEARLKPKWQRLVRAAQNFTEQHKTHSRGAGASDDEDGQDDEDAELDPLSFRPNPTALLDPSSGSKRSPISSSRKGSNKTLDEDDGGGSSRGGSAVYRPPKLAPVPYSDRPGNSRRRRSGDGSSDEERAALDGPSGRGGGARRPLNAHLLPDLSTSLSSNPYTTSSTGLSSLSSSDPHGGSSRARRLREMEEYEEANFTRLVLSKKDERKRRRDEEDVVLGGATTAGISSSSRRGGAKVGAGLEEEFGDLLRGGERRGGRGDSRKEWDQLTRKRLKATAPAGESQGRRPGKRSSASGASRGGNGGNGGGGGGNRFEKAVASQGKKRR